jgi:hypothetical protein
MRRRIKRKRLLLRNSRILSLRIGRFIGLWKDSRRRIIRGILRMQQEKG